MFVQPQVHIIFTLQLAKNKQPKQRKKRFIGKAS